MFTRIKILKNLIYLKPIKIMVVGSVFAKIIYGKPLVARAGYDLFHFSLLKKNPFKIITSYFICLFIYKFSNIIFSTN